LSSRVTLADFRFLSVRDRLAPERPPRGWRLLRPLPGGYDGIPSGPASRARTRPYPRCRLRRRSTSIRCLRGRPIGPRDADRGPRRRERGSRGIRGARSASGQTESPMGAAEWAVALVLGVPLAVLLVWLGRTLPRNWKL